MANRITDAGKPMGFAVMDPRWIPANLAANDGAANNSSYTENGPRPGAFLPGSNAQLGLIELSNGQENDVMVRTAIGGKAAAEGASHIFRRSVDTLETDWYGWDTSCQPVMYSAAFWSDAATRDALNIAVFPQSQEPIVLMDGIVRRWSHATNAWISEVTAYTYVAGQANGIVVIPGSERVIVLEAEGTATTYALVTHYSDDGGATWVEGSRQKGFGALEGISTISDQGSLAYGANELIWMARDASGADEWHQFASADLGATWQFIDSIATLGQGADVFALPGGGFGLTYMDSDADTFRFRKIGGAYELFDNATEITIADLSGGAGTSADGRQAGWIDPDGTIWAMADREFGTQLLYSVDDGDTWRICSYGMMDNQVTGSSLENWKAVAAAGGMMLIGNHTGVGSDEDGSVDAIWAGGWTKVEAAPDTGAGANHERSAQTRFGFGIAASEVFTSGLVSGSSVAPDFNLTWFPFDLPDHTAGLYSQTGTAGTLESPGMMEIDTTATNGSYSKSVASVGTSDKSLIFAELAVIAGSSLITVIDILYGNAAQTVSFNLDVLASATQFRLADPNGSTLATVDVDMTAGICLRIRVQYSGSQGRLFCEYRPRGMRGDWIVVDITSNLADGGSNGGFCRHRWGNIDSSTMVTNWYSFHSLWEMGSHAFNWGATPDAGTSYHTTIAGRWLTGRPMPAGHIGGTSDNFAHLAVKAGPFFKADTQTATVSYDFPIENIFPTFSPSPAQPWRSSGTASDVIIALDYTRVSLLDGSVSYLLYIGGTNLEEVKLEGFVSSSWSTLGTLVMAQGFTGLNYAIAGDLIVPNRSTTASAGRYIQANEFRDGYVDVAGKTRKIVNHTGGAWQQTTTPPAAAEAFFRIEGVDGTESALGTATLRGTAGILVVVPTTNVAYSKFRLKIVAADNIVAESYFQIGTAHLGAVTAVGKRWQRGFSRSLIPNTTLRRDTRGTIRRRQDGPPARRWVQSWPAGVDMLPLRSDADTDFISAGSSRYPLVARGDVRFQLMAALVASRGGELPVVAISDISDADTESINDRTRFIYGTLTGTIQANNVTGEEGAGEAERIESVTISEIV